MRIRKRYQNPLPPPDLSSPFPPLATAVVAVAPPAAATGGATGGKEGEAMAAAAVAATHVPGGGCGGGGGRGLHPNGHTTNPTTCLPFDPPPLGAAPAGGGGRGDLPPSGTPLPTRDVLFDHGHDREVPKRKQDGEDGKVIGDAQRRWKTDALGCGDNATTLKRSSAEAFEPSVGHGVHKTLLNAAVATPAVAEAMARWSGEEGEFPSKKRRAVYHVRGRSLGFEEEEKKVTEREMKRMPSKTRGRRTAASRTTTMAATSTALTSAGMGSSGGAPTGTGASAGAAKKCDDMLAKEEGVDVVPPPAAAAIADRNCCGGNGKKRRSPAVLMEGSRCSRVNGRGWRCCQQTLVGYSLCEHHLGKGRLRSVSSVRCNVRERKKEDDDGVASSRPPSLLRQQHQLLCGGEEEKEHEKPSRRRSNKIGMVKARSISSLLHQPDHSTPTTIAAPATGQVITAAAPPYGTDTAVA